MPLCVECGKTLASPVGLRRHINSQHTQREWHICECGKRFLDPAARSRCRSGHTKVFECPICRYESRRKDAVKQHIRRRHRDYSGPGDVLLSPRSISSRRSSSDERTLDPTPPPDTMIPAPFIPQPAPRVLHWIPQQEYYYPPQSPLANPYWNWYA